MAVRLQRRVVLPIRLWFVFGCGLYKGVACSIYSAIVRKAQLINLACGLDS